MFRKILMVALAGALLAGCEKPDARDEAAKQLKAAADFYLEGVLRETPEIAYFVDLPLSRHDGLTNGSPAGLTRIYALEDETLRRLDTIDPAHLKGMPEWILYGQMREMLEAAAGTRVCRGDLWSVNHMGSFSDFLSELAARQPVGTSELRAQAIRRWEKVPQYIADDIANLKTGVAEGYLSPKPAVARVIAQVDGLINAPRDTSPLFDPARRDGDAMFSAAFAQVIEGEVIPALKAYRDFLKDEYLAAARNDRALAANPDGRECWIALYRSYTTLSRTPEEVYEIGLEAVERYKEEVVKIGAPAYGSWDFTAIVKANTADPANRLESEEAYAALLEELMVRTREKSAAAFAAMPETPVVAEPFPDFLQGTGMSARYEMAAAGKPGVFRYDPTTWETQTVGGSEILTVHEAWPGHHLQIAYAREASQLHPVQKLIFNSAFVEGWARYAEALAEEVGTYSSHHGKIQRRAWPARGMVVDAAYHMMGWTDEQAINWVRQSGRFEGEEAIRMLDRISVIPAQLTAYDSGALEIFALRRTAETALGENFDLAAFHQALLENGPVPLWMLREIIGEWIGEQVGEGR